MKYDLREKCGIIGVWTAGGHAPSLVRRGLTALQHRGQESAGMSIINRNGKLVTAKSMGLIHSVLTDKVLKKLGTSSVGIGQNRYGTSGSSSLENAQPIVLKTGKY